MSLVIVAAPRNMGLRRPHGAERSPPISSAKRNGCSASQARVHAKRWSNRCCRCLPHVRSTMTLGSSEVIKNLAAEAPGPHGLSRWVVRDLAAAKRLTVLATRLPRSRTRRFALIHHEKK